MLPKRHESEGKMLNCSDKYFRVSGEQFTQKDSKGPAYPTKLPSSTSTIPTIFLTVYDHDRYAEYSVTWDRKMWNSVHIMLINFPI